MPTAAGVGRHGAVCHPHLQPDHRRRDLSAPGGDCQRPLRLHRQRDRRQADEHRSRVRATTGAGEAVLRHPWRRHLPFLFPEQGLVMPGQFIPGADSHSRAYGAYGAVGIGVGSTTLGFGWATGYIYFTLAKARRVTFQGRLQPWVSVKIDVSSFACRSWMRHQSQPHRAPAATRGCGSRHRGDLPGHHQPLLREWRGSVARGGSPAWYRLDQLPVDARTRRRCSSACRRWRCRGTAIATRITVKPPRGAVNSNSARCRRGRREGQWPYTAGWSRAADATAAGAWSTVGPDNLLGRGENKKWPRPRPASQ